jgi:hypothetical protein
MNMQMTRIPSAAARFRPPWWRPLARWRWRRAWSAYERLLEVNGPKIIASTLEERAKELGLQCAGWCSANEQVLPDGRRLPREHTWREVPADAAAIGSAGGEMLEAIVRDHGPGRVWTLPLLGVVHLVYDDGEWMHLDELTNRPMVRLRATYCHEANARLPDADLVDPDAMSKHPLIRLLLRKDRTP